MLQNNIPSDLTGFTATAAVRLIHAEEVRPEELMEACLAHIATRDPTVRVFAHFDPAQARTAAAAARPGPLQGIPIGIKDVLDTADMPSQYGSPIWAGWQPKADAAPVAWVRAAAACRLEKPSPRSSPPANPARP